MRVALVAILGMAVAVDEAVAQVAPPVNPVVPPVTSTPVQTTVPTVAPTPAPVRRPRPHSESVGQGLGLGSGGFSGGGSSLGFGIGAAGVALGVGFVGAMTHTDTWSGKNSTPLETGPHEPDPDRVRVPRARVVRTKAVPEFEPSAPPPPPPRAGFAVPSRTELRFVPGEVLLVVKAGTPPQRLKRLETALGLTPLASAHIDLLNVDVRRYGLKPGALVPAAVVALRGRPIVTAAQPNYLFALQIDPPPAAPDHPAPPAPAPPPSQPPAPPPQQYALSVLRVAAAHRLASGTGVRIAVIDSGVDETNPDLDHTVVERFDAVGGAFKAHSHGTAIAGAIVAHSRLVGVAPKAQLIAVRAFAGSATGADGTGFNILRGLDFAASHGARIVNMSFAGPQDLLLQQALAAARRRGIVAVAAAGNGGPLAKPLYPGAERGIIAVTATDAGGRPFVRANRGAYVAVAAPGVDVIAPGLGNSVQITSGTSIATAEASGVVALLLERRPNATPDDISMILKKTARRLDVGPTVVGAGLIDAEAAVTAAK